MAVGCAVPVAGYAAWFGSWWGSYTLSRAEGFYLWGRVSSFYYFHLTPYAVPANHSWVAGGTAYSDTVQDGHATPTRVVRTIAILIDGYQRVFYTYGPLFGLMLLTGLGGVLRIRRPGRWPVLAWSPRSGSMLPWATAVVLLIFPVAVADFDYRYLLPVLPFACLAAGLAFAPAQPARPDPCPVRTPAKSMPWDDLCRFVSLQTLSYPARRSRFVQKLSHMGEAGH
jgi:hypothetical protein